MMKQTRTRLLSLLLSLMLAMFCVFPTFGEIAKPDLLVDGVPLPADASPIALETSKFSGTWVGTWDGRLKTIMIVEALSTDGKVRVIYAVEDNPGRFKRAWFRFDGKISGNTLKVFGKRLVLHFELSGTGRLRAILGDGFGFAVLVRRDLNDLVNSREPINWAIGESLMLDSGLLENGKSIPLETVLFKPPGSGQFPLAVVNHGSTGRGTNAKRAKLTWSNLWLADVLNERGWMVAFPQRRGRGRSGGQYDEGFSLDRSKGYSCETNRSLAGAERALKDLQAAVAALKLRPDVRQTPILLAGNSRGGVLSVAYAGRHPEDVYGVINFVGGWMGDGCVNAEAINRSLFKSGGVFASPMLWVYGKDDIFYSLEHSRENFAAFKSNGGLGDFVEVVVAGKNNGHAALAIPILWSGAVKDYLDRLPGLID